MPRSREVWLEAELRALEKSFLSRENTARQTAGIYRSLQSTIFLFTRAGCGPSVLFTVLLQLVLLRIIHS